jgi:hypothetical protein
LEFASCSCARRRSDTRKQAGVSTPRNTTAVQASQRDKHQRDVVFFHKELLKAQTQSRADNKRHVNSVKRYMFDHPSSTNPPTRRTRVGQQACQTK